MPAVATSLGPCQEPKSTTCGWTLVNAANGLWGRPARTRAQHSGRAAELDFRPARGYSAWPGERELAHGRRTDRMIIEWLAKPIVWAALVSFFVGSFGYVLARLVIRPLLRYHIIKQRIRQALDGPSTLGTPDRKAILREYASALTTCHNEQLPHWYRLLLKNRGEAPLEAARHLMTLANVRQPPHASRRSADVRRALRMPSGGRQDV